MKKFFISLFALSFLFSVVPVFAKKNVPDPYYLTSPVLDAAKIEIREKDDTDPRTFNEKFREKFKLPKTKKLYFHNIDKSNQPITMDDYYKVAVEKKRDEIEIPLPVFKEEDGFIFAYPHFRVVSYNVPPGQRNVDLSKLVSKRFVNSAGILSPDMSKIVYTKCYFYPNLAQTAASAFYVPIKNLKDAFDILYKTSILQGDVNPIISIGMDEVQKSQFKTLVPIDWSEDGTKIAFKEKIGSNYSETWKTNIIIYDFESKTWKRLEAIREAIIYWWRQNKQIELKDYKWDIYPIGWQKQHPDRLIVYAYAYTNDAPLFLGTWSIDFNEEKSELVSLTSTSVEINLNGFGFKEVKMDRDN